MNRVKMMTAAPLLALLIWAFFTSSVAFAGIGDGDSSNYINNGEFTGSLAYWTTLQGTAEWQSNDGGRVALYRDPTPAIISQTVTAVPAGTVALSYRYYSGYAGGVLLKIYRDGEDVTTDHSCFSTGSGGWNIGSCSFANASTATFSFSWNKTSGGLGNNAIAYIDYFRITVDGSGPNIPTEVPPTTIPITTTCAIVPTGATSPITVSANLLDNPSFEQNNGYVPSDWFWDSSNDIYIPTIYLDDSGQAAAGQYSLKKTEETPSIAFNQRINIPEAEGGYLFGAYVNAFVTDPELTIYIGFSNHTVVLTETESTFYVTDGYKPFEISFFALTGQNEFVISFPAREDVYNIYLDQAFLIPVDETGLMVDCGAVEESYNNNPQTGGPNEYGPVESPYGIPTPINGAGSTCYDCYFPVGRGVEAAIAWLGCLIRNMFACSLLYWLYEITNAVLGVIAAVLAFGNFAQSAGQGFANFFGQMYNNLALYLSSVSVVSIQGDNFSFWELIYELIALPVNIISSLTGLLGAFTGVIQSLLLAVVIVTELFLVLVGTITTPLLQIVQLIFIVISSLFQVLAAPALSLEDFVVATGGSMAEIETADGGLMYIAFLWGVMYVDDFMAHPVMNFIVWLGAAIMGLLTLWWLLKTWQNVLPQSA